MTPIGHAGAQLEKLTAAVQERRKFIEADQEALPAALQLALQQSEGTPSSIDSRHVISYRAKHSHCQCVYAALDTDDKASICASCQCRVLQNCCTPFSGIT